MNVDERAVARFLVEKHYIPSKNLVRPKAFLPGFYEGVLVTSVFACDGISESELWHIGYRHVATKREKPLYGCTEIHVLHVERARLTVRLAEPPPRHREIVGWSSDKEAQMSEAQELARNANLRLRADPHAPPPDPADFGSEP